jgi:hypothetical protein
VIEFWNETKKYYFILHNKSLWLNSEMKQRNITLYVRVLLTGGLMSGGLLSRSHIYYVHLHHACLKKPPNNTNITVRWNNHTILLHLFYIDGDNKRYLKELIQKIKYYTIFHNKDIINNWSICLRITITLIKKISHWLLLITSKVKKVRKFYISEQLNKETEIKKNTYDTKKH